jgi:glucan phosphoethanolaminetransferase (alkaline phosphatase superfamily)
MPLTFLLLQLANAALAAASLWIRYKNPALWDDQALVLSVLAGVLSASFTAILLGVSMVFSREARWLFLTVHLLLTLAFASLQIYLLWILGHDMGLVNFLRSKLGM